jgi:glycosyltransferase involved in cell wall biosynthesis
MTPDIAIIVPTLRRPQELSRALRSILCQTGVETRLREIIVIDNDPQATAREAVDLVARSSHLPVIYGHEPRPGVATARNAALALTAAPLIAFLDDDEVAATDWLSELVKAQSQLDADVVFGPIRGRVPDNTGWATPYLERFFGRVGPDHTQLINHAYGCGNSLMVRKTALPGAAPFDVSADQSGGEDDALFSALEARGGRFGWAVNAWVDEYAPPHRATLRYALARAFAYGQSPAQIAHRAGKLHGVVFWMGVGVVQTLLWSLASVGLMIVASPRRAETLDRAARGLGKIFWMEGLEPRFYGLQELERLNRVTPSGA